MDEFEILLKHIICWNLDSLSFFEDDGDDMYPDLAEEFIDLDSILKTKEEWEYYYAYVDKFDRHIRNSYILLVNEKEKKYMLVHGVEGIYSCLDEKEHRMKRRDFIKYVEKLNEENYEVLSYAEGSFYEDIE